jgi:hypothetical protein
LIGLAEYQANPENIFSPCGQKHGRRSALSENGAPILPAVDHLQENA